MIITCPWCDRKVQVRSDKRIRKHISSPGAHHTCSGSNKFPEECPYNEEGEIKISHKHW